MVTSVGLIAKLLQEVPAAGKYRAELEALERSNESLRAENADLKEELAQFIQNWVTLDWDSVRTLAYLSQHERAHAEEIAEACQMNAHLVQSHLNHLVAGEYVHPPRDTEPRHSLAPKGRRYVRERGMHK
jgi:DNA-binding MarR family transcriptional regulator